MKIYNEIVIDMNPESSTFEEVLHEDSFEYVGDMMLMQDPPGEEDISEQFYMNAAQAEQIKRRKLEFKQETGISWEDYYNNPTAYPSIDIPTWATPEMISHLSEQIELSKTPIGEQGDFGMESLTQEMYQGKSPREMAEYIFQTKYDSTPPVDGAFEGKPNEFIAEIIRRLQEAAPQLGQPSTEETGFLAEQYGGGDVSFGESLTGQKASMQREQDIYGLQSEAYKFAPAVSTATGMGGGMRGQIAGQETIGRGFDVATDKYGLTKDVAEFDYRKGMYGLEKEQIGKWESNFKQFLGSLPEAGGE